MKVPSSFRMALASDREIDLEPRSETAVSPCPKWENPETRVTAACAAEIVAALMISIESVFFIGIMLVRVKNICK